MSHSPKHKTSKNFKRKVRERMEQTGESYATARRHIENQYEATAMAPNEGPWLEERRKRNPMQAVQTERIVKRAGRTDVCSICGDLENLVYRLSGGDAFDTIRLCNYCVTTQRDGHGAELVSVGRTEKDPLNSAYKHTFTSTSHSSDQAHILKCFQCNLELVERLGDPELLRKFLMMHDLGLFPFE